MMDFEEFKKSVADNILDYLPGEFAGADVSIQDVIKNNDTVLSGLLIRTEDSNIAPNIYLEGFFEKYESGMDLSDIMETIARTYQMNARAQDFDVSFLTDFEQVKDKIICKLINADMNSDYLSDKPYTLVEDLAVTYAIDLGEHGDGHMTSAITKGLMEKYGVTTEELHDIAMKNLSESRIEFRTMRDVLVEMLFPDGIEEGDPRAFMLPPEEEKPSMFVLSNASKLNGATAILDQKTMENIAERLGGDFIVLPSSIHETIVLPLTPDMDRHTLESMVQDVNAGQVKPEERLSDHVYMYDSQEKELVLADKMEERRQERAEAQKDANTHEKTEKAAGCSEKTEKSGRSEKKPDRSRVSMKDKIREKKAEVEKNEASRETPVKTKNRETTLA